MFDVQSVSLRFGERDVLKNASFKVEDGERAAIIGANGAGKSTLLKIVAGVANPETGAVSIPRNTEIGYLPQQLELDSSRTLLGECRQVFADVLAHESEMRDLEGRMAEVPHDSPEFEEIGDRYEYLLHETQRRDLYSMDSNIGKILSGLGFKPEEFEKPCTAFSGGWQMRIALARILLQNPEVLLLDEPTNHLDIETIDWLGEWIRLHDGSVLLVSHERAFMDKLVNKVIELERGNVHVYRGNYSDSLVKREERREMARRTYENQQAQIAHVQKFIDRFRYQASKATLVQSRVKQLEKMEMVEAPLEDQGTIHFTFPPAPRCAKEVLNAHNIRKSFGDLNVLDGNDLIVYRGEKIALVGVNGAGKTTLMRILAGRDTKHDGSVELGANVDMSYFAQYDQEGLHPSNDVLGEFQSSAPLAVSNRARTILGAFLFSGEDVEKKISVLSGGEKTRLRLAKMLCGNSNLLLLDEPTNHLDLGSRLTLESALRQFDGAIILVSHDRYFLDNVVNRVVEVSDGKLTSYQGNYEDYLRMKELREGGTGPAPTATKTASTPAPAPAHKETSQERRARQEREKKNKNRLRKLEREVSEHEERLYELEETVAAIENEIAKPEVASDFDKLGKLTKKLDSVRSEKEDVETNWLALQEELETLNNEAGE